MKRYHYWDVETKEYLGACHSTTGDISDGGGLIHQEFEVPPFPEHLLPAPQPPEDGWYIVERGGEERIYRLKEGHLYYSSGVISSSKPKNVKFLKRVKMEDI